MNLESKLKKYMLEEMRKIVPLKNKEYDLSTFSFCWGQAKFDMLMDIDRTLNLGVFYKK